MMALLVFYGSAVLVAYAYVGYLLVLLVMSGLRHRPIAAAPVTPTLSLIITVRNEEARIEQKLEQTLELDYPVGFLEVVVASDCSTDRTHALVEAFRHRGVKLVIAPDRRGKEFAQKLAIDASTGEVLVFSDVATQLDGHCLRQLAGNFADAGVGAVSSVDRLLAPDGTVSPEGLYVKYEMLLRSLESSVGTIVGLSGSLFAARRTVCEPWATDVPSDFNVMLNSLRLGLRGVSDPNALGYYSDLSDPSREYGRKVRTVTRGISSLARNLHLLNPIRYRLVAWQLLSHKLCRWLVPFGLVGLLVSALVLAAASPFFRVVAALQVAAYVVVAIGSTRQVRLPGPLHAAVFFVVANVSILHAWFNVLRGRRIVTWEPSVRPGANTIPGSR